MRKRRNYRRRLALAIGHGLSGSIERLIEAFGATVAIFEDESRHRFRHRSGALHAPAEIVAIVRGIFGLHQWPRSRKLSSLQRHATPLRAREVAARYQFPEADGRGQTVGVVQLNGVFKPADFDQCLRAQHLSAAHPIVKRVDNAVVEHEIETIKDLEAALDVQIIASLAPAARIVVYEAPNDERGFLDAVRTALFDDEFAPSVLSISYGWPEHLWTPVALDILDELFTVAALLGVSVYCASGDNGAEIDAAGKPHVLAPASSPFAVACGATVVTADGSESAWEKTGGGFSERFALPPWQTVAQAPASRYAVCRGTRRARRRRAAIARLLRGDGRSRISDGRYERGGAGVGRTHGADQPTDRRADRFLRAAVLPAAGRNVPSRSPRAATIAIMPAPRGTRARVSAYRTARPLRARWERGPRSVFSSCTRGRRR